MKRRSLTVLGTMLGMFLPGTIPLEAKEEEKPEKNYLYLENAEPVVEFRPELDPNPEKPAFLYGADTGPRLVLFYAPWCPHVSVKSMLLSH